MELNGKIISFNPIPEGISHRHDLFALYKLTLHTHIAKAFGWDESFQRQLFTASYADKDCYFIAVDDVTIGYLVLKHQLENTHLSLLLIRPEYQRQGIGRQVMKALMSRAAGVGQGVTLSCFQDNQSATAFYQMLGFEIVSKDDHFVTLRYSVSRLDTVVPSEALNLHGGSLPTAARASDTNAKLNVSSTVGAFSAPASHMGTLR
ncbi:MULTISPECIES: GNAT family N-acetyltransferase [Pseudomonas]|uniref:GNAT family N-acetyltransferase n=1 Tax=Pseudomonas yamanorum TaxID=515393 RepID=A0A7Y8JQR8_9PSED|nr:MULTISPECIES: GNAT family N-acetyltransferase [Pseudomonas]MDF3199082.1 GNAT family N-acetyltransferase [Pseudomonas sp. 1912-s]NWE14791.1 GNAT family N-acetyltransferase [Pseudomonas yamanorum]